MKRKIGLYNPYLDSVGGGERHVLSILEVLQKEAGFEPFIFWDKPEIVKQIKQRLGIDFKESSVLPNIFRNGTVVTKLQALKDFDIFLYVTDGSYFFSSAKKNYVFCMVPNKHLYGQTVFNWLKTMDSTFIANSEFTQANLKKWGITSTVLYPYISSEYLDISGKNKKNMILVAGRFFGHLHSKRQDIAIEAFKKLQKNSAFKETKLVLAGSVADADTPYFKKIESLAKGNSAIIIKKNLPFEELVKLYSDAKYYWHFTGYGVDEAKEPEKVEHLGITPLEAMAAGCIPFCYNAGGLKEIITHGKNGFLFQTIDDLIDQMIQTPTTTFEAVREHARNYVKNIFSYKHFTKNVLQLFTQE